MAFPTGCRVEAGELARREPVSRAYQAVHGGLTCEHVQRGTCGAVTGAGSVSAFGEDCSWNSPAVWGSRTKVFSVMTNGM